MTLQRQILTSKNTVITIETDDPVIQEHFTNPANYADVVLNQINHDRIYDQILDGEEDLVIIDIGGNIGLFSLYAQDCAKAVYPIEPTPNHYYILENLTSGYGNIHPQQIALYNEDTMLEFFISEENSTMNSAVNRYGNSIQVQGKTLSTLIRDLNLDHVDFIKCDIEGSEMAAITDEIIASVKDLVDVWFIEVHSTAPNDPNSLQNNRDYLQKLFIKNGYQADQHGGDILHVYKD